MFLLGNGIVSGMNWKAAARVVRRERARVGLKQKEAASAAGLGITTWQQIERGTQVDYRDTTLAKVELLLGLEVGTLRQVASGDLDADTARGRADLRRGDALVKVDGNPSPSRRYDVDTITLDLRGIDEEGRETLRRLADQLRRTVDDRHD